MYSVVWFSCFIVGLHIRFLIVVVFAGKNIAIVKLLKNYNSCCY